jgi:hypothetical protein
MSSSSPLNLGEAIDDQHQHHQLPPVTSYTTVIDGQHQQNHRIIEQPYPATTTISQIEPAQTMPREGSTIRFHDVPATSTTSNVEPNSTLRVIEPTRRDRSGSSATARSSIYSTADTTNTSTLGGGDGEDCVKEKRIKEWRKHFQIEDGEGLVCSTSLRIHRAIPCSCPRPHRLGKLCFHADSLPCSLSPAYSNPVLHSTESPSSVAPSPWMCTRRLWRNDSRPNVLDREERLF